MRTNSPVLDAKIDAIFAEIFRDGMSTHDKVKACYDYLCAHYLYQDTWEADTGVSYYSGRDDTVASLGLAMLEKNKGVCDHYSSAFVVMTRAIGLESYYVGGQTRKADGVTFTPHAWVNVKIGDGYYIFDPQVEGNIAGGGKVEYYRFCKTDAELSDRYKYEDRVADIAAFGSFRIKPGGY